MIRQIYNALKKRPIALMSVIILLLLYVQLLFVEFLAPYTAQTVFQNHANHPPLLKWYSKELGFKPQVQKTVLIDPVSSKFVRVKGCYYPIKMFVKGPRYSIGGGITNDIHLFGTTSFYDDSSQDLHYPVFLFGSDSLGRDIFSRILYGSRISLTIGLIAIIISLSIALIVGGVSGIVGGKIDWFLMRLSELFILIPGLYLILFIRSLISRSLDPGTSFMLITVILSLVSWPGSARLIRGMVHSIKREDFVLNAMAEGVPILPLLFRYILPQMSSILIISVTLGIPGYILGETVLSYLGLGIVDPSVSWGSLISRDAVSITAIVKFPWLIIPGVYLIIVTLCFNFFGEFLRDFFDPYHRSEKGGL